jgi:exonuclease SbcC
LISGEVFRPLEFVKKSPEEQAKIILNMLEIPWSTNDIQTWFGELPGVNYEAHILQVLKQIETLYYTQREAINREVKVLEAQVTGIKNELPPNYDGEKWRAEKVSEYYGKVARAEEINRKIAAAQSAIEGLQGRIDAIKANAELDKQTKKNAFDRQRSDGREFRQFINEKISKIEAVIAGAEESLQVKYKSISDNYALDLANENADYQRKLQELKEQYEKNLAKLELQFMDKRNAAKVAVDNEVSISNGQVAKCKESLAAKEQELLSIDSLEEQSMQSIGEKMAEQINAVNAEVGNAQKILDETKPIDTMPLTAAAEKVVNMQSYLREFDRMDDMIKTKIAPRQELAQTLTARIETARTMPMELLKVAAVPIPEIAVDGDGKIRIGKTLLDGLSEGEQLELAVRMASAQAGDLRVVCIDGISKINQADRKWLDEKMVTDDLQYFLLDTNDSDLNVKIEGVI